MAPTHLRSREVVAIQILRAMAATLVVLFHTNLRWGIGRIGVDIFFTISGFVMLWSTENLVGFKIEVQHFLEEEDVAWRRPISSYR